MASLTGRVGKLEAELMPASMLMVILKCFDEAEITGMEWGQYGYEPLTTDRLPGESVEALRERARDASLRHAKAVGCELNGVIALAEVRGASVA